MKNDKTKFPIWHFVQSCTPNIFWSTDFVNTRKIVLFNGSHSRNFQVGVAAYMGKLSI